ncbi:MAG: WG repeat-containing protein [Niastella sp.]|nr:WG repeat-containing protein [Niastella sp.]
MPRQYEGLTTKAVVKTNGKFGVLDAKTGTWTVPAQYDEIVQTFRYNKIAIAVTAKGVTKYLDYNGKPIQPSKPQAGSKEQGGAGVARMETTNDNDQRWDPKDLYVYNLGGGNWKLSIETRSSGGTKVHQTFEVKGYADVEKVSFYDEVNKIPALIKAVKDGKAGIIGLKGEVLVPFIYDNIGELKVHSFFLETTLNNKTGVLRRDLTELSKPVLKQVLAEEQRLKAWYVEMPNGYRGYMDKETGKIFIPGGE